MSETSLTIGGAGSYVFLPYALGAKGIWEGQDVFGGQIDMIPEIAPGLYTELFGKIGQLTPSSSHGLAAGLIWNGGSRYHRFIWDAGWKYLAHPKPFIEPYFEIMLSGSHLLVNDWDKPYHQLGFSVNAGCNLYFHSKGAFTFFIKDHIFFLDKSGSDSFETNFGMGVHVGMGLTWFFGKSDPIVKSHLDQPDMRLIKTVKSNLEIASALKDSSWLDQRAKIITSQSPNTSFPVLVAIEEVLDWFFSKEMGTVQYGFLGGLPSLGQYLTAVFSLSHASFNEYAQVAPAEALKLEKESYQLLGDIFELLLRRLQKEIVAATKEGNAFISVLKNGDVEPKDVEEPFLTFEKRVKLLGKLVRLSSKLYKRLLSAPYFYEGKPEIERWKSLSGDIQQKVEAIPVKELRSLMKGAKVE